MQLRTRQIGLNKHFHWICCSDTPCCPSCNENAIESIHHFLFDCVHYRCEWSILHQKLQWHSYNMSYLLSHPASSSAQICSFNWQTETDIWGTLFRKPACSRHNIVHHLTGRAMLRFHFPMLTITGQTLLFPYEPLMSQWHHYDITYLWHHSPPMTSHLSTLLHYDVIIWTL